MHLLPCPSCNGSIPVSPSQAGDRTNCPDCQAEVPIPKLGDLRLLPQAEETVQKADKFRANESSGVRSIGFGLFAFLAAGCLLVSGYCGIRWLLTDVTMTTDQHIAALRTEYKTLDPARLIREYESMEEFGLELPEPFPYKIVENAKRAWGRNALIAMGVGLFSFMTSIILGSTGRRQRSA
jgi:hypothetical protein